MKTALRRLLFAAVAVLPLAAAMAQTPESGAAVRAKPAASARPDKKIERIRTEDAGTRIDELRVGGETQQITVQPKTGGATYEVKPAEGVRGTAPAATSNRVFLSMLMGQIVGDIHRTLQPGGKAFARF